MRTRKVRVGRRSFIVPENIQRIEYDGTRGWQVRVGDTKLFSDRPFEGAGKSLHAAIMEKLARLREKNGGRLPYGAGAAHRPFLEQFA